MEALITIIIYLIGILFLVAFFVISAISLMKMIKSLLNNKDTEFDTIWTNNSRKTKNEDYTDYEDIK